MEDNGDQLDLPEAVEVAAKTILETWGGPWAAASLGRKMEARKEASRVLEALRNNAQANREVVYYMLEGRVH